ncbi:MAG: hypothetical protein JRC90_08835 [Deltaproteobacteria bacterium]|nr:hypothetical protein [Deltaproteobacteria bacterium]
MQKNEAIIEKNLKAFYKVGHALKTIRDDRLYRKVQIPAQTCHPFRNKVATDSG